MVLVEVDGDTIVEVAKGAEVFRECATGQELSQSGGCAEIVVFSIHNHGVWLTATLELVAFAEFPAFGHQVVHLAFGEVGRRHFCCGLRFRAIDYLVFVLYPQQGQVWKTVSLPWLLSSKLNVLTHFEGVDFPFGKHFGQAVFLVTVLAVILLWGSLSLTCIDLLPSLISVNISFIFSSFIFSSQKSRTRHRSL